MNGFTIEQQRYLKYLKNNFPLIYADAVQPILSNNGMGAIGADASADSGSTWTDILSSVSGAISQIGTTYTQYASSQKALENQTALVAAQTSKGTSSIQPMYLVLGAAALLGVVLLARR